MKIPYHTAQKEKLFAINWLAEQFPAAFFKFSKLVKPLKIGIFDDIVDFYERLDNPPLTKKLLREAIHYYSASPAYLACQKTDTARIDLYGNEVDIVTEEQAKYAALRYQERYANKRVFDKPKDN